MEDNFDVNIDYDNNNNSITIYGKIYIENGSVLEYYAANPPNYLHSYTGSGLPFPNSQIAYQNSTNYGKINIKNNTYSFTIKFPNAFYCGLGSKYVEPHVIVRITNTNGNTFKPIFIKLNNGLPYRTLTHPPPPESWPRINSLFYYGRDSLPVRSQEQILRDSSYPILNEYPKNFWGLKPMQ
tara:strand:+ start:1377 stop:1922 length:546 start_codon:yes stop_codon:yes gene_type:complete